VPADPASPTPAALAHLTQTDPRELQDAQAPHLLAYLAAVPDPRATRGRRHSLVAILALAATAVLAGARAVAAIAEWAADAPQPVRAALGARRAAPEQFAVPAEATIGRTLARLDAKALAGAIGAWLADRQRHDRGDGAGPGQRQRPRQRAVAVDGKTLRGAHPPDGDGRPVHLLAAMEHASRNVLAQHQVGGAPEEVPAFQPLLDGLDLAGAVVTAEALHTHPDAAEFLVTGKQAHYLFTVKANQPTLLARCQRLPWHHVPVLDTTGDRGHGRIEHRTLKAVTVHHFGFPHTAQILQVTRKTRALPSRRWRTMTVYAVTSLTHAQAAPPGWPTCSAATGRSRRCTTSAMSPSPRTLPRSAPAPAHRPWPARATSPSACSAAPGRSTWHPPSVTTPATPPDPSPPWGSPLDESDSTREHRSLARPAHQR
jgi:DDE_Tnp_1-associated/Transposase DDE domain